MNRSSRKRSVKRKSVYKFTKSKCKSYLKNKIKINIGEYKSGGRYKSITQAIAVSYNQVLKKRPRCKRYLKKKSR